MEPLLLALAIGTVTTELDPFCLGCPALLHHRWEGPHLSIVDQCTIDWRPLHDICMEIALEDLVGYINVSICQHFAIHHLAANQYFVWTRSLGSLSHSAMFLALFNSIDHIHWATNEWCSCWSRNEAFHQCAVIVINLAKRNRS